MKHLTVFFYIGILVILSNCGVTPMNLWLQEYETLLKQSVHIYSINPSTEAIQTLQTQIAEKEAEVDGLLRNASMQDQMTFLSKYYDMRVQFYYAVQ